MPYRNGILHGMDLGYDNPVVTAKCWCFLFVIRDWILSKKSEPERKEIFQKETRSPSWGELSAKHLAITQMQKAIDAWKARSISTEYLQAIQNPAAVEKGSPEAVVLEFLTFWKKRNYGKMAELLQEKKAKNLQTSVREVRQQFENYMVKDYSIKRIVDAAPAIAQIDVEVSLSSDSISVPRWTFRLIRENEKGETVSANLAGGQWRFVWVLPSKEEPPASE